MASRLLTDNLAAALPAPRQGRPRKEVRDARVKGLMLRVTPGGARTWSVEYKVAGQGGVSRTGRPLKGRGHRITLGPAHAVSVDRARSEALDILRAAANGVDPADARRDANERRFTNTVRRVTYRMVEDAKLHLGSWAQMEAVLRLVVLPKIGDRPVADLTRADVSTLLDELKTERTVATAREARKYLSRLLNFAADRGLIAASPMTGLRRSDLAYVPRERALSDAELRAAWLAAGTLGYPYGPAIRLLLLTGQRRGEICRATWADVDERARTLAVPASRHKQRRGHVIPLADAAWEIVESVPRRPGQAHLFVGRTGEPATLPRPIAEKFVAATHAQMIDDDPECEVDHFQIRDLRRTCKTRLAALGVRADVRDAVLGHAPKGMDRTYNVHEYIAETRAALEAYAAHVLELAK